MAAILDFRSEKFQLLKFLTYESPQSGHLGFPIRTILLFLSTSHPDASYKVLSQVAFRFGWRSEKYIFKMAMAAILDF